MQQQLQSQNFDFNFIFDCPPIDYAAQSNPWRKLQEMICSPFSIDQDRFNLYCQIVKKRGLPRDLEQLIQQESRKFPFYYIKLQEAEIEKLKQKNKISKNHRSSLAHRSPLANKMKLMMKRFGSFNQGNVGFQKRLTRKNSSVVFPDYQQQINNLDIKIGNFNSVARIIDKKTKSQSMKEQKRRSNDESSVGADQSVHLQINEEQIEIRDQELLDDESPKSSYKYS